MTKAQFARSAARAAVAAILASLASPILAQAWPDKPVRVVVPYPPGGNVDSAGRIIGAKLQEIFKQPFLVDNKPGAGGMIAAEAVARARPDGYTLFLGANGPILFSPMIYRKNNYDWKKDFIPVSSVSFTPVILQVNNAVPFKTVGELIAAARKPGNDLTMASPGAGTQNHLASEYLQHKTGAHWITVHYKGNAPATTDLLGGQVQFNFDQLSVALPFIQQGRTRALAVGSAKRLPQLPNVPTFQESGFPDMTVETFTGLLAPAGTPQDIVQKLSGALRQILADKDVQAKFEALGAQARGSTPEQFKQFLTNEDKRWTPLIKQANITAE
ncbi:MULTISPECIES: Bug family tripartite tricarboxylate transporter substrate binding protein [Cupriavidus]